MLPAGSYNIICSESRHRNRALAKNFREDAKATRRYHNRFRWVAKKLLLHLRIRNGKTKISNMYDRNRTFFPLLDTNEALICCGMFLLSSVAPMQLVFFFKKYSSFETFLLPAGYTEELASIMSGGQKMLGSFNPYRCA